MNLLLNSELQQLIDDRVKTGKYATPQDVVTAAILTLEQQERCGNFAAGELDALLAEGEQSIALEGTLDGEEAFQARRQRRAQKRDSSQ